MEFLGYKVQRNIIPFAVKNSNVQVSASSQQVKGGGSDVRYGWTFQLGPEPDTDRLLADVWSHYVQYGETTPFDFEVVQFPGNDDIPTSSAIISGLASTTGTITNTVPRGSFVQMRGHKPIYVVNYDHTLTPRLIHAGRVSGAGGHLETTPIAKVVYSNEAPPREFAIRRGTQQIHTINVTLVEQR